MRASIRQFDTLHSIPNVTTRAVTFYAVSLHDADRMGFPLGAFDVELTISVGLILVNGRATRRDREAAPLAIVRGVRALRLRLTTAVRHQHGDQHHARAPALSSIGFHCLPDHTTHPAQTSIILNKWVTRHLGEHLEIAMNCGVRPPPCRLARANLGLSLARARPRLARPQL